MEDNNNGKIKKYVKCSTCKIFDQILVSPLLQNVKCQKCNQPLKEISLEEYNQKLEIAKKHHHHKPSGIKIKVITGSHGLHNLIGFGGGNNNNNNINNNNINNINDNNNSDNQIQNNNQQQEHQSHHRHHKMIIIAPFSRHHYHSNNNNNNTSQNNNNNVQNNQNELNIMVRSHNISSDIFDPNFTSFGTTFNQVFQNNFSSNFRSNFISGNFISAILNIIQRNMSEVNINKHKQHPISEENIKKLKKFKLSEKYCKIENNNKIEKPNCCICLEEIEIGKDTLLLPCGHMFHDNCCMNWLYKSNTCPVCRFEIK